MFNEGQKAGARGHGMKFLLGPAFLAASSAFWLNRVNILVPGPYLDEVFHVKQAQVYCGGDFQTWDTKITTPPGLYLVSWLIYRITGQCSIGHLRALNVGTLIIGSLITIGILRSLRASRSQAISKANPGIDALTAFNIWFFPPLFFFSGLYYTDLQSSLWVLLALQSYLRYQRHKFSSGKDALSQLKFGIIALFFRQTNIFWVAVFPAALALIALARQRKPGSQAFYASDQSFWNVCKASWTESTLYDPPVYDAWIEDYLKTALSIVIVSVRNLAAIIPALVPYILLLVCFAGFVFWNGGVVLGDKSNHIATIHLPQMLYLWPYMLFFSFPVVVHSLLQDNIRLSSNWKIISRQIALCALFTSLAVALIHFNTIIHPFALADNRHYIFYVFRILLRHPAIRYLVAPVYIVAAYLIIQTLGKRPGAAQNPDTNSGDSSTQDNEPGGCRASFVLVWLATTALSLVTAPLVEPRYCIIPWMMWRLHVPRAGPSPYIREEKSTGLLATLLDVLREDEIVLSLEVAWFVVVNVVTGYLFLHKGFAWPQEPGNVQRFLW